MNRGLGQIFRILRHQVRFRSANNADYCSGDNKQLLVTRRRQPPKAISSLMTTYISIPLYVFTIIVYRYLWRKTHRHLHSMNKL